MKQSDINSDVANESSGFTRYSNCNKGIYSSFAITLLFCIFAYVCYDLYRKHEIQSLHTNQLIESLRKELLCETVSHKFSLTDENNQKILSLCKSGNNISLNLIGSPTIKIMPMINNTESKYQDVFVNAYLFDGKDLLNRYSSNRSSSLTDDELLNITTHYCPVKFFENLGNADC